MRASVEACALRPPGPAATDPDRLCPIHKGSVRQRLTRTMQGWVAELGRRVKGIFKR